MRQILQNIFIVVVVIFAALLADMSQQIFAKQSGVGNLAGGANHAKPSVSLRSGYQVMAQVGGNNIGNGRAVRKGKKFRKGQKFRKGKKFREGKKIRKNRIRAKKRKAKKAQMKALNARARRAFKKGQYAKAQRIYLKILALKKSRLGPGHWKTALTMNALSATSFKLGRFKKALSYVNRSLAIHKRTFGAGHKKMVRPYHVLARTYNHLGRFRDAEKTARTALRINLKTRGKLHERTAKSYYLIGFAQIPQGKFIEAEKNLRQSLEINEKTLGVNDRETARTLRRFADLFKLLNRAEDALPLIKRGLAIRIQVLGAHHPDTGRSHFTLAEIYRNLGEHKQAETHFTQAIKIHSKALGEAHQYNILNIDGLAKLYRKQQRYEAAVQLLEKSDILRRKTLGALHPHTARGQFFLANLYRQQGRYEKAEQSYKTALTALRQIWGDEHGLVTNAMFGLGRTYLGQNRITDAFDLLAMASTRLVRREVVKSTGLRASSQNQQNRRLAHVSMVIAAWRLAKREPGRRDELRAKAFKAAQLAGHSSASLAVAKMSARFGAGSGPLAKLARQGQDFNARWQTLNKQLLQALGVPAKQRNKDLIKLLRAELSSITQKLSNIDQRLARDFPRFTALAKGRALSIQDVQAQLGDKEGLVFFLSIKKNTFVWLVTKTNVKWLALGPTREALAQQVSHLRNGLDIYTSKDRAFIPVKDASKGEERRPYDLQAAHKLYEKLLGRLENITSGLTHLVIIPDGPLTAFPFHALVKTSPDKNVGAQDRYQRADWLVRHFATSILPSVNSLKALRDIAQKSTRASRPMIGFGDPVFDRSPAGTKNDTKRGTASYASFFKGPRANLGALKGLQRLPGTRTELLKIAQTLNVGTEHLKLGVEASEQTVKATKLDDYRIVYFATHGLVAGDVEGLGEPALALTVPLKATKNDDGLLTASEVATLKLNADWLIMSACNTAAGDKPGAEALSGLARAFFYAGAKTLLVSHWPVDDGAAVSLTTRAFQIIDKSQKSGQAVGRAEALRGSMLAMIDAGGPTTHPTFWAPFIVVGEGAAR